MLYKHNEINEEKQFAERLKRLSGEQYEKVLLGHKIRQLRIKTGTTQKGLACKLKTTQSVIARIETGKQNLTIKIMVDIAGIFRKKLFLDFK